MRLRRNNGSGAFAVLLTLALAASASRVAAQVTADKPAAILVFPKILVHSDANPTGTLDTFVRISNVSATPINVLCYYVNTTPQCEVAGGDCFPDKQVCPVDIGGGEIFPGKCLPQWRATDFKLRLTREQPTGWLVSVGEGVGCQVVQPLCSNDGVTKCTRDSDCGVGNRCVTPPCLPLDGERRTGPNGQTNENSLVPPSPEDPFIGELKCVALDEGDRPVDRNDLIGRALIGYAKADGSFVDVAGYNPIGIRAIEGAGNRDGVLVVGGPTGEDPDTNPADRECLETVPPSCAEYEGCPNILILDHYFDGAVDPLAENRCGNDGKCTITGIDCALDGDCVTNRCVDDLCTVTQTACADDGECVNECVAEVCSLSGERCGPFDGECSPAEFRVRVSTELTLVPCTQDFEGIDLSRIERVVQYLVFNEFEQRFSTARKVSCFQEIRLSDIDGANQDRSIFSAGVSGTLTGQSRIRGGERDPDQVPAKKSGNAFMAIAEEFRCAGPAWEFPRCNFASPRNLISSAAKNLHSQGRRPQGDYIYLTIQ